MDHALDRARRQLNERITAALPTAAPAEVRAAPAKVEADLCVPLFAAAKDLGVAPPQLGDRVAGEIDLGGTLFRRAFPQGGFLNLELDGDRFTAAVIEDFERYGSRYGGSEQGTGKTVVIDLSSPNIAKPLSVGHLRSTVIGDALGRLYRFLGYRVVADNHLGDWGTQFGKLLAAYAAWGDDERLAAKPIEELLALYVRFHEEVEKEPQLEREARRWFKRLEAGDDEAQRLWQRFRDSSLEEFQRVYDLLGVRFDEALGESFYNDRLEAVVAEALASGRAEWGTAPRRSGDDEEVTGSEEEEEEQVALIRLDEQGIELPLLIQKSDGTSLYATRDLATAIYRFERWQPERILYVVGAEQQLYFRQLFAALTLLGYDGAELVHVPFGLVRLPKGRMSTRKGRVIFLEEVLDEAIERAAKILEDRDLTVDEKAEIARQVGVGAVKFADLSQTRTKEVVFDWDRMLSLEGDTAPYLQYALVRIRSILRKAGGEAAGPGAEAAPDPALLTDPAEVALVKELARFPEAVRGAARDYHPHLIATYLLALAKEFSAFYTRVPVLRADSEERVAARLGLCRMTAQVLERGLDLLGIECPEKM